MYVMKIVCNKIFVFYVLKMNIIERENPTNGVNETKN